MNSSRWITLFLIACSLSVTLRAAESGHIEILHQTIVFEHTGSNPKDPANLTGFNHAPSVVLLPDGKLMAAWFSAPSEGSSKQKIVHSFSADQGKTWSPATTLQDVEGRADFDPSFVSNGRDVFFFYSVRGSTHVMYVRHSSDSGKTWSESLPFESEPSHTSRTDGIRLSSSELLVPLHRLGTGPGGILKSSDEGKTWKRFGQVANPSGNGGEPTIAELKSGKIMMLLRTKDGLLWKSISGDKGETWSMPEKTGLTATASSHNLFRLHDGTLLLTHNPEPKVRFPLTMRLSKDDGVTWSEPTILTDRPKPEAGWQVCYPSVAQLSDETVVVTWAQIKLISGEVWGDIHAARIAIK